METGASQRSSAGAPHGLKTAGTFQVWVRMIRLDNVSKQNGHQILFIEASTALYKGEKVGLVGPNGGRQDHAVPDDHGRGAAR
jgi:hypothetical protein